MKFLELLLEGRYRVLLVALGFCLAAAVGAGGMYFWTQPVLQAPSAPHQSAHKHHRQGDNHKSHAGHKKHKPGLVKLPKAKQKSAGLKVKPAYRGTFQQTEWVTGKVTLNEDRLAHIYPLVNGRIHKVRVRYGEEVAKGDVLAVIDSREVGDAKLALHQDRLETRIAGVNHDWAETINENTQALIKALEKGASLEKIESMFPEKPMGTNRQRLLSSYADLHEAKADYDRLKPLTEKGITSEAQLIAAKAAYEAARAKLQAWLEQLKFTARQNALHKRQKLQKSQSQESVSQSKLYILGHSPGDLKTIDPQTAGEAISHYQVKAPFDGTILQKDAAIQERVGPDRQLFQLADLSTVWIQADIYQKHLPILREIAEGETIRFRTKTYGKHIHEAEVFYAGEVLDPTSRTARLRALADNRDGHLKPGMFVEVQLPGQVVEDVLQIPASAVIENKNQTYVFIQKSREVFLRQKVKLGRSTEGLVEIVDGLKAGQQVVTGGLFALKTAAEGKVHSTHSH